MISHDGDPTGNIRNAGFRSKALGSARKFVTNRLVLGIAATSIGIGGTYAAIDHAMADGPIVVRGTALNVITDEPEIIALRDKTCADKVGCPTDHDFVIQPENRFAVIEVCKDLDDQVKVCDPIQFPVTNEAAEMVAKNVGKIVELGEKDITSIKPTELHRR